jgi:hypothetical protein
MKNSTKYTGGNPASNATRYGNNHKKDAAVAKVEAPTDDQVAADAAQAAVAITSIQPAVPAKADANVNVVASARPDCDATVETEAVKPIGAAEAKVDALANVKSGDQILADTRKPAASKHRGS